MKNSYLIITTICLTIMFRQADCQVKSEKVSFHVKTTTEAEEKPTIIKILDPDWALRDSWKMVEVQTIQVGGQITTEKKNIALLINNKPVTIEPTGHFWHKIDLKPGPNPVGMIVAAGNDIIENYTFTIYWKTNPIDLMAKGFSGKYYALIIGINDYIYDDFDDLAYPRNDAAELYSVLNEYYMFEKENMKLMTDPRREEIIDYLGSLSEKITKNDNLLVFYAGHGKFDKEAEVGWWLPSDAQEKRQSTWIANSSLVDNLRLIDSRHTLLISDACFSGSIFRTRSAGTTTPPRAIENLHQIPSRKAMTSGNLGEVPDRSVFVRYLIESLKENNDDYLPAEDLFMRFNTAVRNNQDEPPRYGVIQNVGDKGGEFIFIRRKQ